MPFSALAFKTQLAYILGLQLLNKMILTTNGSIRVWIYNIRQGCTYHKPWKKKSLTVLYRAISYTDMFEFDPAVGKQKLCKLKGWDVTKNQKFGGTFCVNHFEFELYING